MEPKKTDIFSAKNHGFYHFRIPVLAVTKKGTILAFCEARKKFGDWSPSALVMKRSVDNGENWSEMIIIHQEQKTCTNNPSAIVDQNDNTIHLLFCTGYNRVFYSKSSDDGLSFSDPIEITFIFTPYQDEIPWKVVAIGPGGGIQLSTGRIVVPFWMAYGNEKSHRPSLVSTIYSDDHALSWKIGQIIPYKSNSNIKNLSEACLLEIHDNGNTKIIINMRNEGPYHKRAISYSYDGIANWTPPILDEQLYEPVCMAYLIRYDNRRILFSNPDSEHLGRIIKIKRLNLTIKVSYDECKTWSKKKVLEEGLSAYSSLAIGKDGNIYCLYERGGNKKRYGPNQHICFAKFSIDWLED